jgi:hypothetical protein
MQLGNISANQLTVWTALVLGMIVAVFIGSAVGSSDIRMVAGLLGLIPVVIIFIKLKTNIWVLLPIGWYLSGRLPWLPVPFTVRDLCFIVVIFFFTLFFATRTIPWRRKLNTLDYLIYINLAYLAVVYIRNPAGFWAIQTSIVGGRPYFEIAFAFAAFIILSRVNVSDYIAKIFPLFFVLPTWLVGILDLVARLLPQTGSVLYLIYSGVGSRGIAGAFQQDAQIGETRMTGLQSAGTTSVMALCSKYDPLELMSPLHPFKAILLGISFAAIFLSGYRSAFLFAMTALVLAALLRGRIRDLWIGGGMLLLVLVTLISLQGVVLQLPTTMQRTLSWLPGQWSAEALHQAEGSSQWRFEMWEWAWNDDRILRDRIWGQGFGLSMDDMNLIANALMSGEGAASRLGGSDRENFMITGSFHSGPLSTIKYIGVVGLVLYYPLMCYMAVLAWKLCRRARGTKGFSLALFVSIPIIYEPFNFVIIFGGLDGNYPQLLFWAGLLNMTQRYVEQCFPARVVGDYGPVVDVRRPDMPARELGPMFVRRVA